MWTMYAFVSTRRYDAAKLNTRPDLRLQTAWREMQKMLRIDQICLDFQRPENLIEDVVQEYVDRMIRGERIDPISVCYDGKRYLLKDGFHRLEAAQRLRRRTISAEVTKGT